MILLEDIIRKQLRSLVEAKEAKGKLAKQIDEFAEIHSQIVKLEAEIKKLKDNPKYADSKEKVSQIMEELKATGQDTMETKRFIVKITRSGSEAEVPKYSKILEEFLPKVSIKLRETYSKIKQEYTSVSKKSPSLDVKAKEEVKEGNAGGPSLGGILSSIKSAHSMINRLKAKFN
jgi:hypothetical protein